MLLWFKRSTLLETGSSVASQPARFMGRGGKAVPLLEGICNDYQIAARMRAKLSRLGFMPAASKGLSIKYYTWNWNSDPFLRLKKFQQILQKSLQSTQKASTCRFTSIAKSHVSKIAILGRPLICNCVPRPAEHGYHPFFGSSEVAADVGRYIRNHCDL